MVSIPLRLVVLGGKDYLRDRGTKYYEAIKVLGKCKHVNFMQFEKEEHGFYLCFNEGNHKSNNERLMRQTALFVTSNTHSQFFFKKVFFGFTLKNKYW